MTNYSFLFNDKIPVFMTVISENKDWILFNKQIAQAKSFKIFKDNQLVATFKPLPYTIRKEMKDIGSECNLKSSDGL